MKCRFGIVVVHYGDDKKMIQCMESIRDLQFKKSWESEEIFVGVVDNNKRENNGYAEACNYGFDQIKNHCLYVIFLNNDTFFNPDFLQKIWDCLEDNNHQIDFLCPKVININNEVIYNGGHVDFSGSKHHIEEFPLKTKLTDFIYGCCFIVKTEVYDKLKMRDDFFMYYEDVELTLRAKKAVFTIACTQEAVLYHDKPDIFDSRPWVRYYQSRNILYCMESLPFIQKIPFAFYYMLVFIPKRIAYFLYKGNFETCKYILLGTLHYFKGKKGLICKP